MKKRLRQILSLLCILALALGCVTIASAEGTNQGKTESHIIYLEWSDGGNAEDTRPDSIVATYAGEEVTLTAPEWTGEVLVPEGTNASWNLDFLNKGYTVTPSTEEDGITRVTLTHALAPTISKTARVEWEGDDDYRSLRPESVQLILEGNDLPVGEPQTAKAPSWEVTWGGVPAYDSNGNPIQYKVKQMKSLSAYSTECSGLTVKNVLNTGSLKVKVSLDAPEGADLSGLKLAIDGPDPRMKKTLTYADIKSGTYSTGSVLEGAYLIRDTNADTLIEGYVMDPENSKVADAVYVYPGTEPTLEFKYTWKLQEPIDEEVEEDYNPLANIGNLTFEILGPDARTTPLTIKYSDFKDGKYELPDLEPGVYTVVERNAEKLVKY